MSQVEQPLPPDLQRISDRWDQVAERHYRLLEENEGYREVWLWCLMPSRSATPACLTKEELVND